MKKDVIQNSLVKTTGNDEGNSAGAAAASLSKGVISDEMILESYNAAADAWAHKQNADHGFVILGVEFGLILHEARAKIQEASCEGIPGRNQHSEGEGFLERLERLAIPSSTAYNYLTFAGKLVSFVLKVEYTLEAFSPFIAVESRKIPLRNCLDVSAEGLSGKAFDFNQEFWNVIREKTIQGGTMRKGLLSSLNAINGIKGGNAGNDRKAPEIFIPKHFKNAASFLRIRRDQKTVGFKEISEEKWALIFAGIRDTFENDCPQRFLEGIMAESKRALKVGQWQRVSNGK